MYSNFHLAKFTARFDGLYSSTYLSLAGDNCILEITISDTVSASFSGKSAGIVVGLSVTVFAGRLSTFLTVEESFGWLIFTSASEASGGAGLSSRESSLGFGIKSG